MVDAVWDILRSLAMERFVSEEVKVHFLIADRGTRPPCGMVGDSPGYATTVPANVTCYLCMQSRSFKPAAPDLATRDARWQVFRQAIPRP